MTEFGFNTSWSNKPGFVTSEALKAQYLTQSMKRLSAAGAAAPVFGFTLNGNNHLNPGFGLITMDKRARKPHRLPAFTPCATSAVATPRRRCVRPGRALTVAVARRLSAARWPRPPRSPRLTGTCAATVATAMRGRRGRRMADRAATTPTCCTRSARSSTPTSTSSGSCRWPPTRRPPCPGPQFGGFFYNGRDERGHLYTSHVVSGVDAGAFADMPQPRITSLFEPTFSGRGTVRVDDLTADPRLSGMPPRHLTVRSYLATPVVVTHRRGHRRPPVRPCRSPAVFDERSERAVRSVAAQAAVAIENARLLAAEQVARRQAEQTTARLALLQEVTARLARTLTTVEAVDAVMETHRVAARRGPGRGVPAHAPRAACRPWPATRG